jgi:PAS domain-containing protein
MKTEETALLKQAFASFDEAAVTLERSYQVLSIRVQELNVELEQSNQALRESLSSNEEIKSHLHAILESLTSGVLVTDLDAQITTVNRAAEEILEMNRKELIGQSLSELLRDWGFPSPLAGEVVRKSRRLTVALTDLRGEHGWPIGRVAQISNAWKRNSSASRSWPQWAKWPPVWRMRSEVRSEVLNCSDHCFGKNWPMIRCVEN